MPQAETITNATHRRYRHMQQTEAAEAATMLLTYATWMHAHEAGTATLPAPSATGTGSKLKPHNATHRRYRQMQQAEAATMPFTSTAGMHAQQAEVAAMQRSGATGTCSKLKPHNTISRQARAAG